MPFVRTWPLPSFSFSSYVCANVPRGFGVAALPVVAAAVAAAAGTGFGRLTTAGALLAPRCATWKGARGSECDARDQRTPRERRVISTWFARRPRHPESVSDAVVAVSLTAADADVAGAVACESRLHEPPIARGWERRNQRGVDENLVPELMSQRAGAERMMWRSIEISRARPLRAATMGEAGYSFSLTTFSPSGKLLQIEHALKAVQSGKTSLGIQGALPPTASLHADASQPCGVVRA